MKLKKFNEFNQYCDTNEGWKNFATGALIATSLLGSPKTKAQTYSKLDNPDKTEIVHENRFRKPDDLMDYKDMNISNINKYTSFYTDKRVIMIKSSKLFENLTPEGRWGNIGAGILPYSKKTNRFLISLRSDYVLEPNTWGVWGGKLDGVDSDNVEKAAIREFREETGYGGNLKIIPSYIFRESKFTYYNFIGIIENEFVPNLDWETSDYKWVTFDELIHLNPKHFGLEKLLKNSLKQLRNIDQSLNM